METKVNNCSNCPLKKNHYGHGENWDYCTHPNSPEGYSNIIENKHPKWCPLRKGSYTISLSHSHIEKDGEIQEYEIWAEGYSANETEGKKTESVLIGKAEGRNFQDACVWLLKNSKHFDHRRMTYWGLKLSPYKN